MFCKAWKSLLRCGQGLAASSLQSRRNPGAHRGTRLAHPALVVIPVSRAARSQRGARRGFSLIEVMVVVIIISILAVLALPSASEAFLDRHVYDDAGKIMGLLRSARTRAIARGGAELVRMTSNGASDRGTFLVYESVTADPSGTGKDIPSTSCKAPTTWNVSASPANLVVVDGLNLNGSMEQSSNIQTALTQYNLASTGGGATSVPFEGGYICYTPLGRSFVTTSTTVPPPDPVFSGQITTTSPIEILVERLDSTGTNPLGISRSVLLPPNGAARLYSHL